MTDHGGGSAVGGKWRANSGKPPMLRAPITLLSWASTSWVVPADARCDVGGLASRVQGAPVALVAGATLIALVTLLKATAYTVHTVLCELVSTGGSVGKSDTRLEEQ
jgi:hypothetical protein